MIPDQEKKYEPPNGLSLPSDIELPATMKIHNLIEKTAAFISKHGLQMEILIKAKQANNSHFDFLLFDSPLNPYYKFLVASIRAGKYVPKDEKDNQSDDSGDEDHYLHPSLLGQAKSSPRSSPKSFNLPQLPRSLDENNSYSQLVKSIRDKIGDFDDPCGDEKNSDSANNEMINTVNNCITSDQMNMSILPQPPPEVEKIIEKLAQYVAKNGEDFEQTIKRRNESRFEFINPGNIYHGYYIKRKLHFLEEKRKQQAEEIRAKHAKNSKESLDHDTNSQSCSKSSITFSLKDKKKLNTNENQLCCDKPKTEPEERLGSGSNNASETKKRSEEDLDLESELFLELSCSNENTSREKQEERKRKAALFLKYLKQKQAPSNSFAKDSESGGSTNGHESPDHHNHSPKSPRDSSDKAERSASRNYAHDTTSRSTSLLPFRAVDKSRDKSSKSPENSSHKHSHSHHKHHRHHSSKHHHSSHSSKGHRKSRSRRSSSSSSRPRSRSRTYSRSLSRSPKRSKKFRRKK